MAQVGIHTIAGMAVRKWIPARAWLMLGIVLGNLIPDLDNLAVAIAMVTKQSTEGLHRTLTHSLFTVAVISIVLHFTGKATNQPRWINLGWGLGLGMLMHILLDLLIWFNGVALFWPLPIWINLWTNVTPPEWWMKLMDPAEFLFIALFFLLLDSTARKRNTDTNYLKTLRVWTIIEIGLFVLFSVLVFTMDKGFLIVFGGVYLLSLLLAVGLTIWMRETIEAL
jgi:membrane-bound metal-dependent hydrolase YbcI (DUF457 family)